MKSLRFISSKVIKNLIEGQVDIITKKAEQDEAFYMRQTCPRCKGTCRKIGNPHSLFVEGELLPQFHSQCLACGCEFDPKTGLIYKLGNVAQALEPAIPIINKS